MNASRAKRRLLAWMRYIDSTQSVPGGKTHGGYHNGHAKAYADVARVHRWASEGFCEPWIRTARRAFDHG